MQDRRTHRQYPRAYDDGFRSGIATAVCIAVPGAALLIALPSATLREAVADPALLLSVLCGTWVLFALVYLVWTHLLFTRADASDLRRIADIQHHRRPSPVQLLLGFGSTGTGTVNAALFALFAAVGTAMVGTGTEHPWRLALVLCTVASCWAAMVYSFALRYLRLDAAEDAIEFDIRESPGFGDFLSLSVMISSVGALSGGTPRARTALTAMRTHTLFAFVFNAFIVAMTVSLVVGLVTA
ncbi:DUF1345 domain-containing protein [Microbacterium caowuchunii]|uniref:DUF1345 domain-containing protein n=1 Tax=Microbacterium caowuchunii TaxID=2614638 RepID=A0A5N0T4T8_9MICO|nr:DUF1345 domain-containing protein [Microbacterium caowuchunii]KAA9130075.1 DUF1345 domain-containing protein [Microbacterium caowuchunii]